MTDMIVVGLHDCKIQFLYPLNILKAQLARSSLSLMGPIAIAQRLNDAQQVRQGRPQRMVPYAPWKIAGV